MTPSMESAILARLAEMEKSLEQRLESLNRKVVDTAKQQTKDLDRSFRRVEAKVDGGVETVTGYQKLLADTLQENISSALNQLVHMRSFQWGTDTSDGHCSGILGQGGWAGISRTATSVTLSK